MPLSTRPNATTTFNLSIDADIPIAERPVFSVRFMSDEEHKHHGELMEQAKDSTDNAEARRLVAEAIALGVVGWKHFNDGETQIAFSIDEVFARLTEREIFELAWGYPTAVRMLKVDRPL